MKMILVEHESSEYQSKNITAYYFEDSSLISVKISHINTVEAKDYTSSKEFYVIDERQFISKEISCEILKVETSHYHSSMKKLELIKEKLGLN